MAGGPPRAALAQPTLGPGCVDVSPRACLPSGTPTRISLDNPPPCVDLYVKSPAYASVDLESARSRGFLLPKVVGLHARQIALGAMYFGTRQDRDQSFAILDRFAELGGRWLDTADNYSFWEGQTGFGGAARRVTCGRSTWRALCVTDR